jgi:hypothetical protein
VRANKAGAAGNENALSNMHGFLPVPNNQWIDGKSLAQKMLYISIFVSENTGCFTMTGPRAVPCVKVHNS